MTISILFLFLSILGNVNYTECNGIQEGVFNLESAESGLHTIVRTKDKQTEKVPKTGLVSEFDIRWTSDCTYLLYNRRVIKGQDNFPADVKIDTFHNEIIEIKGNLHKVKTYVKAYDFSVVVTLMRVDTVTLKR